MKEPILTATFAEPVHFKLWTGTKPECGPAPYNLCEKPSVSVRCYTPLRSLVTCPVCLERLR